MDTEAARIGNVISNPFLCLKTPMEAVTHGYANSHEKGAGKEVDLLLVK